MRCPARIRTRHSVVPSLEKGWARPRKACRPSHTAPRWSVGLTGNPVVDDQFTDRHNAREVWRRPFDESCTVVLRTCWPTPASRLDLGAGVGSVGQPALSRSENSSQSPQVRADLPGRCLCMHLADLDDPPTSSTAVEVFRTDREQRNEKSKNLRVYPPLNGQ